MKNWIIFSLLLFVIGSGSQAQNLPKCIEKMNRKDNLTTTKFERVIQLSGNRTVYEFSVKSMPNCIHCPRGLVYYDANCNTVAYFMNSRGPEGFVADGYSLAEFGQFNKNIRMSYGEKQEPVAPCITKIIANADSLTKAGVIRVLQVRIKDKVLYYFEKAVDPKLANCKDCSKTLVYYNEDCKTEVNFISGGIAGVKGDNGYTVSDFSNKRTLRILWNAN